MSRYERNHPALSDTEQVTLGQKRVLIAGCGGLGGYIVELIGRIGVGHLTVVDGDVFSDSNLNRQLLSSDETMGKAKPVCAAERLRIVNPLVEVRPVCEYITKENAERLVSGHDIVVDALDNGPSRVVLADTARTLRLPLVSGAISGWRGRVFVLLPGENAEFLWGGDAGPGFGNLGFTAAAVASVQAAETVKVLLGRADVLKNRLLEFDLLSSQWEDIPLDLG